MRYIYYLMAFLSLMVLIIILDLLFTYQRKKRKRATAGKGKFYTASGDYEVIYEDVPERGALSMWLNDETMLYGRPDMVIKNKETKEVIVIDYKSGIKKTTMPIEYQVQLSAYFLLVENEYNLRPQKGIIKYLEDNSEDTIVNDASFLGEITRAAQELAEVKRKIENKEEISVKRSHCEPLRCAMCMYKEVCIEKL